MNVRPHRVYFLSKILFIINGLESLFSCDVMEKVLETLRLKAMHMVELNLEPKVSVTT